MGVDDIKTNNDAIFFKKRTVYEGNYHEKTKLDT